MRLYPKSLWKIAGRKLDQLDSVLSLDELCVPPGNRLEALSGIGKDNTVYALMTSTEFVSDGQRRDRLMLKSQIIIKKILRRLK
jgi:hypothetical protein